ncbi:hypothetical protein DXM21_24425 [Agrobacterium rosae]|nr:hypothetical protein DXM21_24425 [Agrobacterium rosae]KAA3512550.1 hypothetical protein DXM25_24615 [Agrobacterium rosae]MQB51255.1 hypothetical protein [Agrobacterium rosae]
MHFHIDRDIGNIISGWVILDNPSDIPEFTIVAAGKSVTTIRANVLRTDLRDVGLHTTGLVGFEFDEFILPALSSYDELSLKEATSGIVFYRRSPPSSCNNLKLIISEVGCVPQVRFKETVKKFLLPYTMVDQYSLETITSIVANHYSSSIMLAGQLNWLRHGELAREKDFLCVAILRDPFVELAERLLFVRYVKSRAQLSGRDFLLEYFAPIVPLSERITLGNTRTLISAFRDCTAEERRVLRSPMTYLFGATPDEVLQRRNVSIALDNLAQFDVVGVREKFDVICNLTNELVGHDVLVDQSVEMFSETYDLAASLRSIGIIADLLDEDIALHSYVNEAVDNIIKAQGSAEGEEASQMAVSKTEDRR